MSLNNIEEISFCIHQNAPKIHCLTNPVTMQDVANLLLAAGRKCREWDRMNRKSKKSLLSVMEPF